MVTTETRALAQLSVDLTQPDLFFTDDSGKRLELNFALPNQKVRANFTPSPINDFQLVQKAINYLTFIDPITAVFTPDSNGEKANLISGNGRLALIQKCHAENLETIALGGNLEGLWKIPEGIPVEFPTSDEARDPVRLMQIAQLKNSSQPTSEADHIVSMQNQYDSQIQSGKSDAKAIEAVASLMNLPIADAKLYLKSAELVSIYPFLLDALQSRAIDISVMHHIVTSFNTIQSEFLNSAFDLAEIYKTMKHTAIRSLSNTLEENESADSTLRITRKIVNKTFGEIRISLADNIDLVEDEAEQETKEQAQRQKSDRKKLMERVGTFQNNAAVTELTETRHRLDDLNRSGVLSGLFSNTEAIALSENIESLISITGQSDNYATNGVIKLLKLAVGLDFDIHAAMQSILSISATAKDLAGQIPVKASKRSKESAIEAEAEIVPVEDAGDNLEDFGAELDTDELTEFDETSILMNSTGSGNQSDLTVPTI